MAHIGIIVADSSFDFTSDAQSLFTAQGVESTCVQNIYQLVAMLSQLPDTKEVIVVGSLKNLSKESGRFFQIAASHGIKCLCIGKGNSTDSLSFVNDISQLSEFLKELLRDLETGKVKNFDPAEFAATKTELDALFGNE